MYMVVWTLIGGQQMSRGRAYWRRGPAQRQLLRELAADPGGDWRVAEVSFWSKSAFYATVLIWGFAALAVVVVIATVLLAMRVA